MSHTHVDKYAVLHMPIHGRTALCAEGLGSFIDDSFVFWAGSATSTDANAVANALAVSTCALESTLL